MKAPCAWAGDDSVYGDTVMTTTEKHELSKWGVRYSQRYQAREVQNGVAVELSGIVISTEQPYAAASPDGQFNEYIVEVHTQRNMLR